MSRTIADLTAGTEIWLDETVSGNTNHTPYIYLGLDNNGNARILRKYAATSKRMHSSNVASYNGCEADLWLENESSGFLSRFDADTINALKNTEITYTDYNQSGSGTVQVISITRKCFCPSHYEMGYGGSEGGKSFLSALKTYYNTNTDGTARIGRQSNEAAVNVWLRSASSATQFRSVYSSGSAITFNAAITGNWLRPALSVAPATIVSDEGAESIFLLPDGRVTTWNIEATMSLGVTEFRPKKCKLIVPSDTLTSQLYVCNNYGDTSPTWVLCANGGTANFGNSKTAEDWELGVKIVAQSPVSGRAIGEPAMIVEFEENA